MHSLLPHYFSQLHLPSVLEMSSNGITILYQLSGAEHPSFNIKTQLGEFPWSGSMAGATAAPTAFCLYIAGDVWGQSSGKNLEVHSEIVL